jgi:hypothetical protein
VSFTVRSPTRIPAGELRDAEITWNRAGSAAARLGSCGAASCRRWDAVIRTAFVPRREGTPAGESREALLCKASNQ